MATPSLTNIPVELRLKIWNFVLAEQVTTELCENIGLCNDHDYAPVHSQPRSLTHRNPAINLMILSKSTFDEVSSLTKTLSLLIIESHCIPSLRRWVEQEPGATYVTRFQAIRVVIRSHHLAGLLKPGDQVVALSNCDSWSAFKDIISSLEGNAKLVGWEVTPPPEGLYLPYKLVLDFERVKS